jgi:hypothetical protein
VPGSKRDFYNANTQNTAMEHCMLTFKFHALAQSLIISKFLSNYILIQCNFLPRRVEDGKEGGVVRVVCAAGGGAVTTEWRNYISSFSCRS